MIVDCLASNYTGSTSNNNNNNNNNNNCTSIFQVPTADVVDRDLYQALDKAPADRDR